MHIAAALPPERAATAAIAQFGTPQAVADAFSGELATAYARRPIACFIATGPPVGVWCLLPLHPSPWRTGLFALVAAIPVVPLIVIAVGATGATLATTGRLMRWLPETNPQRALAATTTIAALCLIVIPAMITIYLLSGMPATRGNRSRRRPYPHRRECRHDAARHRDASPIDHMVSAVFIGRLNLPHRRARQRGPAECAGRNRATRCSAYRVGADRAAT